MSGFFFSMVINILCSHAFLKIILEPREKIKEIKFQNGRTFFPEILYLKDFFTGLFYQSLEPNFWKLFSENFLAVTGKEYSDMISDISLGMNSLHLFIPFCSVGTFAEICSVNRSVEIVGMTSTGKRIMQNGGLVISFNDWIFVCM